MSRIDAAANCAEPANVVADITIAPAPPEPASTASRPNEAPKSSGASASGSAARTPSRMRGAGHAPTLPREDAVGAAGAAPTLRRRAYGSRVMRFSGGGAIGECAMKYRASASRSTSPPSGFVH